MALARRRRLLATVLLVSTAVTVGGLVAARYVRSPEQALADIGPPPAAPILEPVERRVLSETVTLRGKVAAEGSAIINVSSLAGVGADLAVVTAVPVVANQEVAPGDIVLEMSGRPVILLQGAVPFYRDLQPGDHGDDVARLQQSLTAIGYDLAPDGEYGPATAAAVERLYADRGYEAPTVGDPAAVKEASRAVLSAQYALDDAKAAVARRQGELAQRAQKSAELDLDLARERWQELAETTGPSLPRSEVLLVPDATVVVRRVGVEVGFTAGTERTSDKDKQGPETPDGTLSFSWGKLTATAVVTSDHRKLLRPDMTVDVVDQLGAWSGAGRVAAVADEPAKIDGVTGFPVTVVAASGDFPSSLVGSGVRITVSSAKTQTPILVVPLAALASSPGGQAVVDRVRDASRERVTVTVGAQGDGYVEVTPDTPHGLQVGDSVVVGLTSKSTQPGASTPADVRPVGP